MSKIRNEDLVLKVSGNVDPKKWDEGRYDAFVDALCEGREYQKEAIFTALRFLVGGEYPDLRALARENFDENPKLAEAFGSWDAMESRLQLPDLLSCSLDLATGTGKSYVLYGIAAILLAKGTVDRVLVLCPSNTIEHGLTEKFKELAADPDLLEAMPADMAYHSPQIIDASESIVEGCICVENYHAILKHVKSAVRSSLKGKGEKTLVLNDEAHHVASATTDLKKWKEFLIDKEFGFRRVVGVSGTCYVGNDYFADVVSRYSLRQAIEERHVKEVEYIAKEPKLRDSDEKWQLIHKFHKECARKIKRRVPGIRPLTIVVTKNIRNCESVAEELRAFLQESERISEEQADSKVLVVTSSQAHQRNIARLRMVDSPQSKVEWIISVSMLSEGWDVKNVFQILPHEERAFNSKLLIAQVLGRGLRVPENWHGEQAKVTVFNHESWAPKIEHLVNEILEMDKRVSSVVLRNSEHHFTVHNLEYEKTETSTKVTAPGEYNLFERGHLDLPTLLAVVLETVRRSGIDKNKIPDEAKQKFLGSLGVLHRKDSRNVAYRPAVKNLVSRNTRERHNDSCSAIELQRDKAVFHRSDCEKFLPEEQRDFFRKLTDPDGDYAGCANLVENDYNFKTPVNLTIADSQPERKFMRELCKRENAEALDAWLKNTAMNFYTIEYAWSKPSSRIGGGPSHIKRGMFSPDFFIKQGGRILVVEIKDDSEINNPSPENIKKHEFARAHFARLNGRLFEGTGSVHYQFNMLTPQDYGTFFALLREKKIEYYHSRLDAAMLEASQVKNPAPARFNELDVVRLTTDTYASEGLKRGKSGTVVLVYDRSGGGRAYEVDFEDWDGDLPFTSKSLGGDEISLVKKWKKR